MIVEIEFLSNNKKISMLINYYKGWTYETKTKNLKIEYADKMLLYENVKYESLKVKIIKKIKEASNG